MTPVIVGRLDIDSNAAAQAVPTVPGGSLYRLSAMLIAPVAPPATTLGESVLLTISYTDLNKQPQSFEVGPICDGQFDQYVGLILVEPNMPVTATISFESASLLAKFFYTVIVEQL